MSIPFVFCSGVSLYEHFLRLDSGDDGSNEEERFYIRLDEDVFLENGRQIIQYELSSDDEFGLTDCGIYIDPDKKDEASVEDKYCILDVNEMDLLGTEGDALPFVLEYNVPRETCEYTSWYIPWHFNQLSGEGPKFLAKCTIKQESSDDEDNEDLVCYKEFTPTNAVSILEDTFGGCEEGRSDCPGAGWIKEDSDTENWLSKKYCGFYDQSSKEGLVNCCLGSYTLFACEAGGGCPTSLDEGEESDWGGDLTECIGGPLRVNGWESHITRPGLGEYPIPTILPSWERGLKDQFEMTKPVIVDTGSGIRSTANITIHPTYFSIGMANYYDGIEELQWNTSCSDCPTVFKSDPMPRTLRGQTNDRLIGYPYFTLECLNANAEALHRVHLIIREWNTFEDFYNFQESNGRTINPDVSGKEGVDCQYYEPDEFGDNDCNDLLDLDDIIEAPQAYPHVLYDEAAGG